MPNDLQALFPRLTTRNHRVTSPQEVSYNCVSWAAGDSLRRWDPTPHDSFWPDGVTRDVTVEAFVELFQTLGFEPCQDSLLEVGYEKIAIYGLADAFTHVALQLESGAWTSKLGYLEDIEHDDLGSLVSSGYGRPTRFLRRQRTTAG